MKIKMLTLQAGPAGVRKPGVTYSVPDAEAQQLIKGGYAVKAETGAVPAPRAATKPQGRTATKPEATATPADETPDEDDAAESGEDPT